jgi:hypothetical protein
MGFISTLTRRFQNNRFSRLSTTSTKLHDEDANDLIKTLSETSATRAVSIKTTSTIVHAQDPVPRETMSNRHTQLRTDDVDTKTPFDGYGTGVAPGQIQTGLHPVRRAGYPVLKLDMCHCSFETPVLHGSQDKDGELSASGCLCSCSSVKEIGSAVVDGAGEGKKKNRRSVADLLKRHCGLDIPRSSISLKTSRSQASPKWLDSGEGEGLMDLRSEDEKEGRLGEKRRSVWGGGGFGRAW